MRHRIIVEFDENLGKSGGISPELSGPSRAAKLFPTRATNPDRVTISIVPLGQ